MKTWTEEEYADWLGDNKRDLEREWSEFNPDEFAEYCREQFYKWCRDNEK